MSTRIYNAYKFNGNAVELVEHLRAFRPKWIDFQVERLRKLQITKGKDSLESLREKIVEESTSLYPMNSDYFDVRGSVVVYFHKRNIYVQTFTGNFPSLIDERFVDFHFQDQADPWYDLAESLSVDEKKKAARNWRTRKKVWNEIFSDTSWTASEAGMVYEMCQAGDFFNIATRTMEPHE